MRPWVCLLMLAFASTSSQAIEHSVHDDQQMALALAAAQPGDVILLEDGRYRGQWQLTPGQPGQPITVQARHPGRVQIGDADILTSWRRQPQQRFTWSVRRQQTIAKLFDVRSGEPFRAMPVASDVDDVVGSFHWDREAGTLYVHPHDSGPADQHQLLAVDNTTGIQMASHTVLRGVAVCGFGNGGVLVTGARDVLVEQCWVFFNGTGIGVREGQDVRVVNCELWGNRPDYDQVGQLHSTGAHSLRVAFENNIIHATPSRIAANFYDGVQEDGVFRGNLIIGQGMAGFFYKTRSQRQQNRAEGNVVLGALGGDLQRHNTYIGALWLGSYCKPDAGTEIIGLEPRWRFADPTYHDYRLQSDSPARGSATNGSDLGALPYDDSVRYVGPQGNDSDDGASIASAWKSLAHAAASLRPGQTLYLLPDPDWQNQRLTLRGLYGQSDKPIKIRAHGKLPLQLQTIEVNDAGHIHLEHLRCTGLVAQQANDLVIDHCVIAHGQGVHLGHARRVTLSHCVIWKNSSPGIAMNDSRDVEVSSSIVSDNVGGPWLGESQVEGFFAGHNFTADAPPLRSPSDGDLRVPQSSPLAVGGRFYRAIGACGTFADTHTPADFDHVQVQVTPHSADIQWTTPGRMTGTAVRWGQTWPGEQEYDRSDPSFGEMEVLHTVSLLSLKANTTYHFQLGYRDLKLDNAPLTWDSTVRTFTTSSSFASPRQLFVSTTGDDGNDGLSEATAWRTLQKVSQEAGPGDVVTLAPGVYRDLLRPLRSGLADRPILFRAMRPLTVELDAGQTNAREGRPFAVQLNNKAFIHLENLTLAKGATHDYGGYRGGWGYAGLLRLSGSLAIQVRHCVFDGRARWMNGIVNFEGGKLPGVSDDVPTLCVEDSVMLFLWRHYQGNPTRASIFRHCVFMRGLTGGLIQLNQSPLMLRNCIMEEVIRAKQGPGSHFASSAMQPGAVDSDFNCWAFDDTNEFRTIVYGGQPETTLNFEQWRSTTGQDQHSLVTQPGYPASVRLDCDPSVRPAGVRPAVPADTAIQISDFILPPSSPLRKAGDQGADIGVRWDRWLEPQ